MNMNMNMNVHIHVHMFSYNNIDIASPLVNAYSKTPGVAEFIKSFL